MKFSISVEDVKILDTRFQTVTQGFKSPLEVSCSFIYFFIVWRTQTVIYSLTFGTFAILCFSFQ